MNILILQASPRANGNTAWMAEEYKNAAEAAGHKVTLVNVSKKKAEVLVLAAPIYYFTLNAQIQAPIQRMYCVNKPAKVKKMALLVSSYSPGVYTGAISEYNDICNYWGVESTGIVTAKIDEQKTEATKQKVQELVKNL